MYAVCKCCVAALCKAFNASASDGDSSASDIMFVANDDIYIYHCGTYSDILLYTGL